MVQLTKKINDIGQIPIPIHLSTFITIPKKPGAMECNKYRTISIMRQLGKVVLRVNFN